MVREALGFGWLAVKMEQGQGCERCLEVRGVEVGMVVGKGE